MGIGLIEVKNGILLPVSIDEKSYFITLSKFYYLPIDLNSLFMI